LQGKGYRAAGWGIDGSVKLLARVHSSFVRAMGSCNYAMPATDSAVQYATLNLVNCCYSGFPESGGIKMSNTPNPA